MFSKNLISIPKERELNGSRKKGLALSEQNELKGFTLIELLVVIAIIGLLSSVVLVSMKGIREKAKESKLKEDLYQIILGIEIARYAEDDVLGRITGAWCSECVCRGVGDLSQLPDTHSCIVKQKNAFNKINMVLPRDPWGSPYLIDENELEFPSNPCRQDSVRSAGPNKTYPDGDETTAIVNFYSGCTL